MVRAFAIHELAFLYERLISYTVKPFVFFLIDIARGITPAPHLLGGLLMIRVGRANEMEVRMQIEFLFQAPELCSVLVRINFRIFSLLLCFPKYLETMFVSAGIEKYVIATKCTVASDNIRLYELKCKSDVRRSVHIGKCC